MVSAGAAVCVWAAWAGTGNAAPLPRCRESNIMIVITIVTVLAAVAAADAETIIGEEGGRDG